MRKEYELEQWHRKAAHAQARFAVVARCLISVLSQKKVASGSRIGSGPQKDRSVGATNTKRGCSRMHAHLQWVRDELQMTIILAMGQLQ